MAHKTLSVSGRRVYTCNVDVTVGGSLDFIIFYQTWEFCCCHMVGESMTSINPYKQEKVNKCYPTPDPPIQSSRHHNKHARKIPLYSRLRLIDTNILVQY